MAAPSVCLVCKQNGEFLDLGIAVASGNIWECGNCAGYFLYPDTHVDYVDSFWSRDRKGGWRATVDRAKRYVPNIRTRMAAILGRPLTSVLEIGCCTGYLGQAFKEIGVRYTGIDADRESVEFARSQGLDAHCMKLEELAYSELQNTSYDLIIACDVLEHVDNPPAAFAALRSMIAGAIVVCVPNPEGLAASLRTFPAMNSLSKWILKNNRNVVCSIDGYWHNIAYSKRSLSYFCQQSGIEVLELRDISVNDAAFGFVQPNGSLKYKLVDAASRLTGRYPQLLLIGRARSGGHGLSRQDSRHSRPELES